MYRFGDCGSDSGDGNINIAGEGEHCECTLLAFLSIGKSHARRSSSVQERRKGCPDV